jgi:hypothetical protein
MDTRGNKDELVDRLFNNLTEQEIEHLTSAVFLYLTTEKGNEALSFLKEHTVKIRDKFFEIISDANSAIAEARPTPPTKLPDELSDILSQETWDLLGEDDKLNHAPNTSKQYTDQRENVNLSKKAIQDIVDKINAHQDGFLTIAISSNENSLFVQTCYDHEGTYFIDSNGDLENLKKLGFNKSEEDFLPCKYVPESEVTTTLLNTLQEVFEAKPGQVVEFNYEYVNQEKN